MLKDILYRALAVIGVSFLGTLGAGSLVGVQVWQAGLIAAVMGLATVLEGLGRSFLKDGKLTREEVNQAFEEFHEKTKKK